MLLIPRENPLDPTIGTNPNQEPLSRKYQSTPYSPVSGSPMSEQALTICQPPILISKHREEEEQNTDSSFLLSDFSMGTHTERHNA